MNPEIEELNRKASKYSEQLNNIKNEVKKTIVGQDEVIDRLIIALSAGGHVLLEGVPGIAKTLTIKTLSECIDTEFSRIQFTPDLLPSDIVGTRIYNHHNGEFSTVKGPVFANFILADEINRAPPKVQSALLEAMQEYQVTIQGSTFPLTSPFFVLATENPIESEGTYPLPEAQVDRFMLKVMMTYPGFEDEVTILDRFTGGYTVKPEKVISADRIIEIRKFVKEIYAESEIKKYCASLVDATRNPGRYGIDAANYISCGASPRASIYLVLGAKAHALLMGRGYVTPQDVKFIAPDVLRHRILLTYEAEAEGVTTDDLIERIMQSVPVP